MTSILNALSSLFKQEEPTETQGQQQISTLKTLDQYVDHAPSDQAALDMFEGEWASLIPGFQSSGWAPLFQDERVQWFDSQCGGFAGKKVLELGPLEGGHTYMLWKSGASPIISIESNKKAYLKCLITKELVGYDAKFLLGDFTKYLQN